MRFRALPTITITWENHENCSHTSKKSTRYRSWHTMVRGEYYLYHILITRICGGTHSSVCYYLSQPAITGCFHNSTHLLLNTVLHLKGQFALVNVVWNEGCILQPEEFLADYEAIYHTFEHFWTEIWKKKEERISVLLSAKIVIYIYYII